MAKIVLDLHDTYNRGFTIDAELNRVIAEAMEKKITLLEIIPGKGAGQLKKRVLRFLSQPDIKKLHHRLEKDDKNFGRIFVRKQFKHAAEREEKTESRAITRSQPLDSVIENLRLPQVPEAFNGQYDVYIAGFNDGVLHGARSILARIRATKELSSMGIAQAKPLISMAAEMRQAEGQAAQETAG